MTAPVPEYTTMQYHIPEHKCPSGNCPFCNASYYEDGRYERIPVVIDQPLINFFYENDLGGYEHVVCWGLRVKDFTGLKGIKYSDFAYACHRRLFCLPHRVKSVLFDIFDVWTNERDKELRSIRMRNREVEERLEREEQDRMDRAGFGWLYKPPPNWYE